MILGPDGRQIKAGLQPLQSASDAYQSTGFATSTLDPGLRGGWIHSGGLDVPGTPVSLLLGMQLNRDVERKAARTAYMINPVLQGALETIHGFIMGEGVSYGETGDKGVDQHVEDFWFANDFEALAMRWFMEFLIDGEGLTIFPNRVRPDEAARIGFYDVDDHMKIETVDGMPNHIKRIEVKHVDPSKTRWIPNDRLVWKAHNAFWNDPRGWPVIMPAIGPSLAYVGFANTRMKIHDLQSRINAIYWAFAADNKELQTKAAQYAEMPETGHVLTMHKLPTGEKEEFEFLETRTNASDSAPDGRLIRLILAVALNLPEHYLGEGGDVNRTTADAMGAPAKKAFKRKQKWVRDWMNAVFRTEIKRRDGPDKKYTVKKYKTREGGALDISTSQVPIDIFEFAWLFPEINDEDAMGLVRKVELSAERKLASKQTLSGLLGYDWAAEVERMSRDPQDPEEEGESKQSGGVNSQINRNIV